MSKKETTAIKHVIVNGVTYELLSRCPGCGYSGIEEEHNYCPKCAYVLYKHQYMCSCCGHRILLMADHTRVWAYRFCSICGCPTPFGQLLVDCSTSMSVEAPHHEQ